MEVCISMHGTREFLATTTRVISKLAHTRRSRGHYTHRENLHVLVSCKSSFPQQTFAFTTRNPA